MLFFLQIKFAIGNTEANSTRFYNVSSSDIYYEGFSILSEAEETKDILTIRVLKNRYTGDTGVACSLHYNSETGRLSEGDFSDV